METKGNNTASDRLYCTLTHRLNEERGLVLLLVRVHSIDGVDHSGVRLVEVRVADSDGEA